MSTINHEYKAKQILTRSASKLKDKLGTVVRLPEQENLTDQTVEMPGSAFPGLNLIEMNPEESIADELATFRHEATHINTMNLFLSGRSSPLRAIFKFSSEAASNAFFMLGAKELGFEDTNSFNSLTKQYTKLCSADEVKAYFGTGCSYLNFVNSSERQIGDQDANRACAHLTSAMLLLESQREVLQAVLEGQWSATGEPEMRKVAIDRTIHPNAKDGVESYTEVKFSFNLPCLPEPITYEYTTLTDMSEREKILTQELPQFMFEHLGRLNKMAHTVFNVWKKATSAAAA